MGPRRGPIRMSSADCLCLTPECWARSEWSLAFTLGLQRKLRELNLSNLLLWTAKTFMHIGRFGRANRIFCARGKFPSNRQEFRQEHLSVPIQREGATFNADLSRLNARQSTVLVAQEFKSAPRSRAVPEIAFSQAR